MWPKCKLPCHFVLCVLLCALCPNGFTADTSVVNDAISIYHTKSSALKAVDQIALRNPSIFQVDDVSHEVGNYSANIKVVTVSHVGSHAKDDRLRIFVNCGEHGRELISVEVALKLLEILSDPILLKTIIEKQNGNYNKVSRLLERVVFKIIPMENVNGRELVENGDLCERKNGNGVDTNRNWPIDWGEKEADYSPYEEYPGSKAFSEPEPLILDLIAKQFKPHIWLNIHSGMEAMLMPHDHIASMPRDLSSHASFALLQILNDVSCQSRCVVGSGGKSVGYLAHGTATDYMHDVNGVPLSFTWEIYGDSSVKDSQCFEMFNPITKEAKLEISERWAGAVLALIENLPASSTDYQNNFKNYKIKGLMIKSGEVYNDSKYDVSSKLREQRLQNVFDIINEVNEDLGFKISNKTSYLYSGASMPFFLILAFALIVFVVVSSRRYLVLYILRLRNRQSRLS